MNDFDSLYNSITYLIKKNKEFLSNGGHKCDVPDFSEGYDMAIAGQTDELIALIKRFS